MALSSDSQSAPRKLILDLDTGIDDTLALVYALASPEVDLIGITATFGNVHLETGMRNDLAVLDLFGRPDVPVFPGLPHASAATDFEVSKGTEFIHGRNGIGEVSIPDSTRSPESTDAVDFLIDAVHTYGRNLVYVPTGPLTNIAAVITKDPSIIEEIGQITLMGGALTQPGNVTPGAEANISQDPEAANALFHTLAPITMIGLDVTHRTLLTHAQTAQWRALNTARGAFLADMTDYYINAYAVNAPQLGGCGLHDPLAVAAAIDPTLVTTIDLNLQVDLDGPFRGRTIGDPARINQPAGTTKVAVDVDRERFVNRLMERISSVAAND